MDVRQNLWMLDYRENSVRGLTWRENLNLIDEANAYFACLRGSQTGRELDGIINTIMNYARDPERVKSEFTAKFAVIGIY
jgi:hypothetical protein